MRKRARQDVGEDLFTWIPRDRAPHPDLMESPVCTVLFDFIHLDV